MENRSGLPQAYHHSHPSNTIRCLLFSLSEHQHELYSSNPYLS